MECIMMIFHCESPTQNCALVRTTTPQNERTAVCLVPPNAPLFFDRWGAYFRSILGTGPCRLVASHDLTILGFMRMLATPVAHVLRLPAAAAAASTTGYFHHSAYQDTRPQRVSVGRSFRGREFMYSAVASNPHRGISATIAEPNCLLTGAALGPSGVCLDSGNRPKSSVILIVCGSVCLHAARARDLQNRFI